MIEKRARRMASSTSASSGSSAPTRSARRPGCRPRAAGEPASGLRTGSWTLELGALTRRRVAYCRNRRRDSPCRRSSFLLLGAFAAGAVVHRVVKEVRRINAELDRVKTGHAIDPVCREVPPTLSRDPRTGGCGCDSRCPPQPARSLALFTGTGASARRFRAAAPPWRPGCRCGRSALSSRSYLGAKRTSASRARFEVL